MNASVKAVCRSATHSLRKPTEEQIRVMSVVVAGGNVRPGDPIRVELPPEPHVPLAPV